MRVSVGGVEVTEAALAARHDEGVASFAEFYAAVLLGILVETDAALCQVRPMRSATLQVRVRSVCACPVLG